MLEFVGQFNDEKEDGKETKKCDSEDKSDEGEGGGQEAKIKQPSEEDYENIKLISNGAYGLVNVVRPQLIS